MKARKVFGLALCVMLLLLATGSGLARGSEHGGSSEVAGAGSSPGAHAPWFIETVDSTGERGRYVSVAIDPQGSRPYVSYTDPTNGLFLNLRLFGNCGDDHAWSQYWWPPSEDARYSSVGSDPAHPQSVGAAYHDASGGRPKYKHYDYGHHVLDIHTIDEGIDSVSSTGWFTSLEYDSNGTPYIAYYFDNPGNVDALLVAYPANGDGNCGVGSAAGDWNCHTVQTGEGVGQYASLALDGDGHFHIAYHDAGNGDLWYATSRRAVNCGPGNSWHCYAVDSTPDVVGQYASIYVDSQDHFHIAYYDDTNDVLKYAVYVDSGGNCAAGLAQCDEIDSMMQGYNPLGVSMAEDPAGYPVIAYQSQYGALNVARPLLALGMPAGSGNCGPETPFSTWHCETIDPAGTWIPYRNGDYVSIAVNSAGLATIAYYGFITPEGGNLMVACQGLQVFLPLVLKN